MSAGVDDVAVHEAWGKIQADEHAILIDVRTRAEWSFVGVPDLGSLGRKLILIEWQTFPDGRVRSDFVSELSKALEQSGASKTSDLYFLCRSGARSRSAAEAMAAAGYVRCHNVAEGFEGPLDPGRQRGKAKGWKAEGLPWVQT